MGLNISRKIAGDRPECSLCTLDPERVSLRSNLLGHNQQDIIMPDRNSGFWCLFGSSSEDQMLTRLTETVACEPSTWKGHDSERQKGQLQVTTNLSASTVFLLSTGPRMTQRQPASGVPCLLQGAKRAEQR